MKYFGSSDKLLILYTIDDISPNLHHPCPPFNYQVENSIPLCFFKIFSFFLDLFFHFSMILCSHSGISDFLLNYTFILFGFHPGWLLVLIFLLSSHLLQSSPTFLPLHSSRLFFVMNFLHILDVQLLHYISLFIQTA